MVLVVHFLWFLLCFFSFRIKKNNSNFQVCAFVCAFFLVLIVLFSCSNCAFFVVLVVFFFVVLVALF